MKSLKERLGQAGAGAPFKVPGDFLTYPVHNKLPAADRRSLRLAMKAFDKPGLPGKGSSVGWSTVFEYVADKQMVLFYPPGSPCENADIQQWHHSWAGDAQGVAWGGGFWFLTQTGHVYACCDAEDLHLPIGTFTKAPIPKILVDLGCDHFGDLDYRDGRLFVPVERGKDIGFVSRFLAPNLEYDAEGISPLVYFKNGSLVAQGHAPWCAINPWDGYLYTSEYEPYDEPSGCSLIQVYDPFTFWVVPSADWAASGLPADVFDAMSSAAVGGIPVMSHVKTLCIADKLRYVQGGCFSRWGHLYLSMDSMEYEDAIARVVCINMATGTILEQSAMSVQEYDYTAAASRFVTDEELEGICLSQVGENVYLNALVWDYNVGDDDVVYFKRLAVTDSI